MQYRPRQKNGRGAGEGSRRRLYGGFRRAWGTRRLDSMPCGTTRQESPASKKRLNQKLTRECADEWYVGAPPLVSAANPRRRGVLSGRVKPDARSYSLPVHAASECRLMTFQSLQAAYKKRGVAVCPVGSDKLPAIRHYRKIGPSASPQLALNFAAIEAAGVCASRRNRITVVDIDSSDDRLMAKVEARFGVTPFRVRTPSGGAFFTSATSPEATTERQRCSDVGLAATMPPSADDS